MKGHGQWLVGIGTASWLMLRAARGLSQDVVESDALTARRLAAAFATYLWRPLPIFAALGILTGLISGTIAAQLLTIYFAQPAIEPVLVRALCRDVLPILLGIFFAGRVSVELAARLAGTALAREIDALEALGRDPTRHILSPALAAVIAAVPVLMLVGVACAIAATGFVLDRSGLTLMPTFIGLTLDYVTAGALAEGTLKALLFAILAFGTGASVGAGGARSPAEIGERATTAFTIGLFSILAAATLWTLLS